MAAGDALPFPVYNSAFRVIFPIFDSAGNPLTAAAGLDTEISQDCAGFADAAAEATEIITGSGMYYLDLAYTEMDTSSTAIVVKTSTTGAKNTPMVLYPRVLPTVHSGTAAAGSANSITLASTASAVDDFYNGCIVRCINNTPTGAIGQARLIYDYAGSTRLAAVATWTVNPSSSTTYEVLATETAFATTGIVNALSTVAKADVNAEVVDALNVDTYAEPGQEAPAATNTITKKLGYLFKAFRNKITQDATTLKIFNDDTATVDHKATVSDSAGTFTRGELGTGP